MVRLPRSLVFALSFPALTGSALASAPEELPPNLLLVVMDDVGVEQLASFGIGSLVADTPTFDALWAKGVLFTGVWSNPLCSPTRAQMITGRFGFETGIGLLAQNGHMSLSLDEATLPEMLAAGTGGLYTSGCFGKWHLGMEPDVGGLAAPNMAGFDHFEGTEANLYPAHELNPVPVDFFKYFEVVNGVEQYIDGEYATTRVVDNALAWIAAVPEPWYANVNFHAPHAPWHSPPAELHTVDFTGLTGPAKDAACYRAALQALDTELGRLLVSMGELADRTVIMVVADNGTPGPVVLPPFDPSKAKSTVYEGGVRVPMVVSGPGVASDFKVCTAPIQTTDIFATLLELAGVDLATTPGAPAVLNSISFVPQLQKPSLPSTRDHLYTELFAPNGFGPFFFYNRAIRDQQHKLVRNWGQPDELYDLWVDPLETVDLVNGVLTTLQQRALRQLDIALDTFRPRP